jgi:pilus assembly protein CpaE
VRAVPRRGAIVAVYGAKGGVGTTTVATNLAVALANANAATLLVDLDLGFGDVGVFLDLEGGEGIAGLATRRPLDSAIVRNALLTHASGLRVLPGPAVPVRVRPDTSEIMSTVDALRSGHFEYVVCDVPRTLSALTVGVLRSADLVVLVTTPELPALRDLERVLGRPTLALRDRAILVVNRSPGRAGIGLGDVTRGLGLAVAATVPSEGVAVTDSINRGVALAEGRSQIARVFRELATRVSAALPERV